MVFIRPTIIRSQAVANELSSQKYNYLYAQQVLFNASNSALYPKEQDTIKHWQEQGAIPKIDLISNRILNTQKRAVTPATCT